MGFCSHVLSYSKVALSLVLARTGPQTFHQVRDAVEIHVYESLSVHHLSFVRFGLRATPIDTGRAVSLFTQGS